MNAAVSEKGLKISQSPVVLSFQEQLSNTQSWVVTMTRVMMVPTEEAELASDYRFFRRRNRRFQDLGNFIILGKYTEVKSKDKRVSSLRCPLSSRLLGKWPLMSKPCCLNS